MLKYNSILEYVFRLHGSHTKVFLIFPFSFWIYWFLKPLEITLCYHWEILYFYIMSLKYGDPWKPVFLKKNMPLHALLTKAKYSVLKRRFCVDTWTKVLLPGAKNFCLGIRELEISVNSSIFSKFSYLFQNVRDHPYITISIF